jgi:hypothetical protein
MHILHHDLRATGTQLNVCSMLLRRHKTSMLNSDMSQQGAKNLKYMSILLQHTYGVTLYCRGEVQPSRLAHATAS